MDASHSWITMIPVLRTVEFDLTPQSRDSNSKWNANQVCISTSSPWTVTKKENTAEVISVADTQDNTSVNNLLHRLPEEVWIHVFSFLPRADLLRASSTSRAWRSLIFNAGRLWRLGNVDLRCSRQACSRPNRQPWIFCQRMGHFLRRLKITCLHPDNHSCRYMAINFRRIIRSLSLPRLTSFRVLALNIDTAKSAVVSETTAYLTKLLKEQRQLRTFQMTGAHWPRTSGHDVFGAVVCAASKTLTDLKIKQFFSSLYGSPWGSRQFQRGLQSFSNLTRLSIDYIYLTDETVITLARKRKGKLSRLSLFVENPSGDSPVIRANTWRTLRESCPDLKIAFAFRISSLVSSHSVTDLLDPYMRLHKFVFDLKAQRIGHPSRVSTILHHVAKYFRKRLARLEIDCSNQEFSMDYELFRLARKCRNLQKIKVVANFSNPNIQQRILDTVQRRHRV